MLTNQSASLRGGGPDLSAHERVNPGGTSGLLLCTRDNSDLVASSGTEADGLLGQVH